MKADPGYSFGAETAHCILACQWRKEDCTETCSRCVQVFLLYCGANEQCLRGAVAQGARGVECMFIIGLQSGKQGVFGSN